MEDSKEATCRNCRFSYEVYETIMQCEITLPPWVVKEANQRVKSWSTCDLHQPKSS